MDIIRLAEKAVIEEPVSFEVETIEGEKKTLSLYPFQAGRLIKGAHLIRKMKVSAEILTSEKPFDELMQLTEESTADIIELIALATLRTKKEVEEQMEERKDMLLWAPNMTQLAQAILLKTIVEQCFYKGFANSFGLVRMLPEIFSQKTQKAANPKLTEDKAGGGSVQA
jgi:single-stranded DNA-specific DHH superfamily exonuclease